MTNILFLTIPIASLFCSIFLFLAVLSAKKSKLINSFLMLLGCFVLWTAGSVFMRLSIFPSMIFWYYVSATGIFCVPYCIYNFLYYYTNRKGNFSRISWFIVWLSIVVLNLKDLFIVNQKIEIIDGVFRFEYSVTGLAVIPAILAAITLFCAGKMIYQNIHNDGASHSIFTPFLIGIIIMFTGLVTQAFFNLNWLNSDTIFCGVNAICVYYALYKKRIITLTPIASNYPIYLLSVAFTTLIGVLTYPRIDSFFTAYFPQFEENRVVLFALLFSILTIFSFMLLHFITNKLFVKSQEGRERELTRLSREIGSTLEITETINIFKDFLISNADMKTGYILLPCEDNSIFKIFDCTQDVKLKFFTLSVKNPLVKWLSDNNQSISYRDFSRTKNFRSMWESEKSDIINLGIELIIPISCEGSLMGIVLLTKKAMVVTILSVK